MATASGTFTTDSPHLKNLLERIHEGAIQLPDFQRGWVWDDDHIRSLVASVSLSFPIGSIMLLQTGGTQVRFKARPVQGAPAQEEDRAESLILDGQQRMTSLYNVLRNEQPVETRTSKKKVQRYYFLDLKACIDPDVEREEAVIPVPSDRVIRTNFNRDVLLDLSTTEKQLEARHIPLNLLLDDGKYSEWRRLYFEHYMKQMDTDAITMFNDFESEVRNRFLNYRLPTIELGRDTAREAVCLVFEKVNTGGVTLTVFELITATYAASKFNLREDWDQRNQELREHPVLRGAVDASSFIQAVTLYASYQEHLADPDSSVSCKRKDMLALPMEQYREYADAVQEGMERAARFLARLNIYNKKNLPYTSQLVPLGAICAALGARFEENSVRHKLAQWYWCGVLGEIYSRNLATRFALDMVDVMRWIEQGSDEPRTVRDANFSPTRLLTLRTRNAAAYKGIMALLIERGSRDFRSGDAINLTTFFDRSVDIHHVFPRSYCKKQSFPKRKWDSVVNKAPLTSATNRSIGGKAPSDYLARIESDDAVTPAELDEILRTHAIEPELLRADNFHEFILTRAIHLLDMIDQAMGKQVQGRRSEDVIEAFGGPLVFSHQDSEEDDQEE